MEKDLFFRYYFIAFILLACLLTVFFYDDAVHAQSDTTLVVSPSTGSLFLNNDNSISLELIASNVVNMNSFDVIISYDSENIQLVDWALGDLVSSFNWKLAEEYADGYFHLSYSEYGLPAVDGDGVLLHLYFTGLEPGVSSVTIDYAAFAEPVTGDKTYPVLEHGIINVGYATSAVGGSILLQGQPISACIPVSLGTGVTFSQGPFNAISTALIGNNLSFPPVVNNDTYTLTTAQPGYLNLDATLSVPAGMDVILPPICLLGGDANGDSIISTGDLDAIRDAFGLLGSGIIADINADGVVDLRDLALAAGNYGLTSAEAYSGWGP